MEQEDPHDVLADAALAPDPLTGAGGKRRGGIAAAAGEDPPAILDALGGPYGIIESAVPGAAYVMAYSVFGASSKTAAIIAVAIGVLATVSRLVRRETVQFALSGLFGVGICAFIVAKTGKATDFYLPGFLLNAVYATVYIVSIAIRRPLIGVLVGYATGTGMEWRSDPEAVRAFTRASWIWVGLFLSRLIVQLPLYFADAVLALGIARTAMGIPLFGLGIWVTWLLLRGTPAIPQQPRTS